MSNRELVRDVVEPLPIVNAANGEPPPRLTPRAEKLLNRGSVRDHWKLVAVRREDYRLFYKMLPGLVARWRPRLHPYLRSGGALWRPRAIHAL